SSIEARTIASSIAKTVGVIGSSTAIGVARASNLIATNVAAYLEDATVAGAPSGVSVNATETATITSRAQAAAVATSFSLGGSTSGGGADTSATIQSSAKAYVLDSDLDLTGDLTLDAENNATVTAFTEAVAESIGLIASATSGSLVTGTLSPIAQAYILNSHVSADDISVTAGATPKAQLTAAGFTLSTGVSFGVSKATATLSPDVTAYVDGAGTADSIVASSL